MYRIEVSAKAMDMLQEHIWFLAKVSRSGARKTKAGIIKALKSLSMMPDRYPFVQADFIPGNKYRKMLVEKRYLVLYQIIEKTVFVELILDCRQDNYNKLLG